MRNNEENNIFEKQIKKKNFDYFPIVWSLTVIFISILVSIGILFAANLPGVPVVTKFADAIKTKLGIITSNSNISNAFNLIGGRQNILLLGVDSNGKQADPFKGTRSDTILVLNIDPLSKTVNALSIPRDSKVYIAEDHGLDKINAAHAFGGPELTIKTIETTFGIKISHYIAVDYSAVKGLVGALGGVPVYVEKRMRYNDNSGGLHIDLYPGYQTLNETQAEGYLRFRHDAIGDIGRMKRQQWFVKGVVKKMQSPEIIIKLPQVVEVLSKYIKTDMNFYQLSQLATFSKFANLDDVQVATLPGKPSRFGHISYWILDPEQTQKIIDRIIYREQPPKKEGPITLSLTYNSSLSEQMPLIKAKLEQAGYSVTCESKTKDPHSQILVHSEYVGISDANAIKKIVPSFKKAQFVMSPNNLPCGDTDLTMVLAVN